MPNYFQPYQWMISPGGLTSTPLEPGIMYSALVWLDESTLVGASTISSWTNKGTGGPDYDYDTALGSNPTRQTINGRDCAYSGGSVGLQTSDQETLPWAFTEVLVFKSDNAADTNVRMTDAGPFTAIDPDLNLYGIGTDGSGNIQIHAADDDGSGATAASSTAMTTSTSIVIHHKTGGHDTGAYVSGNGAIEQWSGKTGELLIPQAGTLFSAWDGTLDYTGYICEYLIFNRVLSGDEVIEVYDWLSSKWAINKVPIDIYDTALVWYKDSGIVGATPVTQWTNEGYGNTGFDLDTPGGTTAQLVKSSINGVDTVRNRYNAIVKTSSNNNIGSHDVFTLFIVLRESPSPAPVTGNYSRILSNRAATSQSTYLSVHQTTNLIGVHTGDVGLAYIFGSEVMESDTHIVVVHSNRDATTSIKIDGSTAVTGDVGGDWFGAWLSVFDAGDAGSIYDFNGDIGEILFFNGSLSSSAEATVYNYLANKFTLSAMTGAELVQYAELRYNETSIVGSTPVTSWENIGVLTNANRDFSVQIGGTPGNLTATTVNGLAAINFAGDAALETPSAGEIGKTATTEFIVFRRAGGLSSATRRLTDARNTITEIHSIMVTSADVYFIKQKWLAGGFGLSDSLDTSTHVLSVRFNGNSTSSLALDGGTPTTGNAGTNRYDVGTIGAENDATNFWEGDICEYIVFDTQLRDSEVALINSYLINKWGI